MNLQEAMSGIEITRKQAIAEVLKHDQDVNEFFAEMGDDETYDSCEVVYWLGY